MKLDDASQNPDWFCVAPLFGGGRGLKLLHPWARFRPSEVAPLFGGGRGLKHHIILGGTFGRVSLLSSEGGVD